MKDVDIRLSEDHKEVRTVGLLQILGHVKVGIHSGLDDRQPSQFAQLSGLGIIIERTGDQLIETTVACLSCCLHQICTSNRSELRTDKDPCTDLFFLPSIFAFRTDVCTRYCFQRLEVDLVTLCGLLNSCHPQIVQDHGCIVGGRFAVIESFLCCLDIVGSHQHQRIEQIPVLVHIHHTVRIQTFHRKRASHTDLAVVDAGLVVEVL